MYETRILAIMYLFTIVNDCPAVQDLSYFVVPNVSHKWYNLGLRLFDRRDEGILTSMRAKSSQHPDEHCMEVFIHWLSTQKNPTWKKLIKSLKHEDINLPSVASDIEKMLDSHVSLLSVI